MNLPWGRAPHEPPAGHLCVLQAGPPGTVMAVSVLLYIHSACCLLGATSGASLMALGTTDGFAAHSFAGMCLLVLIAALGVVLGSCVWTGARWARVTTPAVAVLVMLHAIVVASPFLVAVDLVVGSLVVVLLVVPPATQALFTRRGGQRRV